MASKFCVGVSFPKPQSGLDKQNPADSKPWVSSRTPPNVVAPVRVKLRPAELEEKEEALKHTLAHKPQVR